MVEVVAKGLLQDHVRLKHVTEPCGSACGLHQADNDHDDHDDHGRCETSDGTSGRTSERRHVNVNVYNEPSLPGSPSPVSARLVNV